MHFFRKALCLSLLLVINASAQNLDTVFGPVKIENPAVAALLNDKVMTRLNGIDQSGTPHYLAKHVPHFSRYDHSVGVFALLKKVGVPVEEQIAGLLHDASHTVFSHTGDWVVGMAEKKDAYQDDIHGWYLQEMGVDRLVDRHGIEFKKILHKGNDHHALEQDLPDMCADRIEYNLHTGLIYSKMTRPQVKRIVSHLHFENGKWYFTNAQSAREFAELSLHFTQHLWGSAWNQLINYWSGKMLKRALDMKLITQKDFHFGIDRNILDVLDQSGDPFIQECLSKCRNHQDHYEVVAEGHFDFETHPKFRGIDPYVKIDGELKRLTSIDSDFKAEFEKVRAYTKKGLKIRLL